MSERLDLYGDAYIRAMDRGDVPVILAIMQEAAGDPQLEQLLGEIDDELHREYVDGR
jgi:hypothetical protein